MARLTTKLPLDFDTTLWYGVVTEMSATRITLEADGFKAIYGGRFTYDGWGEVHGRLETYRFTENGRTQHVIEDIGRDVNRLSNLMNDPDAKPDAGMAYIFSGRDRLDGSNSRDRLRGYDGDDRIDGNGGSDRLHGGRGDDRLIGDAGNDRLFGEKGRDVLHGGGGRDHLYGGDGRDHLVGGRGRDILTGGDDADVFRFGAASDAGRGASRDKIRDFSRREGDKIDLSSIDADEARRGDQDFDFIGSRRFSGDAGELRYKDGRLYADTDGDRRAEFEIAMEDAPRLGSGDFLL